MIQTPLSISNEPFDLPFALCAPRDPLVLTTFSHTTTTAGLRTWQLSTHPNNQNNLVLLQDILFPIYRSLHPDTPKHIPFFPKSSPSLCPFKFTKSYPETGLFSGSSSSLSLSLFFYLYFTNKNSSRAYSPLKFPFLNYYFSIYFI